jgi:Anp1
MTSDPTILILTPVKDAVRALDRYCNLLDHLTYPRHRISVGLLEGDSRDGTWEALTERLPRLRAGRRRAEIWKRDFGFHLPPGIHRWEAGLQIPRRTVLAKSRNHLLFHALDDEEWVLWIDVDVTFYPRDILERLLAVGRDIVQPHCVCSPGGETFDHNAWRDNGRLCMEDLRAEGELVRLDAVGGTMLLVRADLHRDGLIFPAFPYGRQNRFGRWPSPITGDAGGELETEGLGLMARDMGHQCWGLPHLEIVHGQS